MAVFKFGQYTQWIKKVATKNSRKYTTYDAGQGSKLFRSGMEQHEFELYYIRTSTRKQKTETPAYRTKLHSNQRPNTGLRKWYDNPEV